MFLIWPTAVLCLQNITNYINISSLLLAINHGVHYVAIIYDILHLDPTIDYNFTTLTQNICPSPASLNPHDGMNAINQSLSKKYEGMKPLISRNCLDIRHLIRFNWSISAPVHQHRPVNFMYQIPDSWHNNVLQYILTTNTNLIFQRSIITKPGILVSYNQKILIFHFI